MSIYICTEERIPWCLHDSRFLAPCHEMIASAVSMCMVASWHVTSNGIWVSLSKDPHKSHGLNCSSRLPGPLTPLGKHLVWLTLSLWQPERKILLLQTLLQTCAFSLMPCTAAPTTYPSDRPSCSLFYSVTILLLWAGGGGEMKINEIPSLPSGSF